MTKLTVSAAADLLGVSRVTVYKWMSNGELAFEVSDGNVKLIDRSEALRVLSTKGSKPSRKSYSQSEQQLTDASGANLQAQIQSLQALLDAKEEIIRQQRARLELLEDLRQRGAESRVSVPSVSEEVGTPSLTGRHKKPRSLFDRLTNAADAFLR